MAEATRPLQLDFGGIEFSGRASRELGSIQNQCLNYLQSLGLDNYVVVSRRQRGYGPTVRFRISEAFAHDWAPRFDTTRLCDKMELNTTDEPRDLEREIVLAMLLGPVVFMYPSFDELRSAVRIRRNIVLNSRKTALAFDTEHAERPDNYWTYSEATGFVLKPGASLIEALQATTQPEVTGTRYSFSCYRATEYVLLLSIAQELEHCNPPLLERVQKQWENRAIMSAEFHDVFLTEYGSMAEPLPLRYYVPGDRVWFRNPDEFSSDAEGYEGSWVLYLGNGLFTNFWKHDMPYTLTAKCIEIFHWRNATYRGDDGKLRVDDEQVDEHVARSLQNRIELQEILSQMLRLREPAGMYGNGGCLDATREHAQWVCPSTFTMRVPPLSSPPAG